VRVVTSLSIEDLVKVVVLSDFSNRIGSIPVRLVPMTAVLVMQMVTASHVIIVILGFFL